MSAEAITDAALRHFAENVSGIRGAYASGAGGMGSLVRTMPADVFDTPVAILEVPSLRWEMEPGSLERTRWYFDVIIWVSATDAAAATKELVPFMTRTKDSLRANATLYGTCAWAIATAGGPITAEEVNGKPYITLPVRFAALEVVATTYSHV